MSRRTGRAGGPGRTLAVLAVALAGALAALAAPPAAGTTPVGPAGSGTTSGATASGATAVEPDDGLPLDVRVTAVTPQVLQPGQDLAVTVRVRNDGGTPVAQPRVVLSLDRTAFIGRFSLDRWRGAAPTDPVGADVAVSDLPAELAPGQQVSVDLVVPAAQVRLPSRATAWGARGLAVSVVDLADPARIRLGVARTFALWFPPQEVTATQVSVLAPIVGPAVDATTDSWVPALEAVTSDGGRLAEVVEATAGTPGVTWLLDPWLLDAADRGGVATSAWAGRLLAGMTNREVQLLPYLDADLTALAHTTHDALLSTAIDRAETTARSHGLPDGARVRLALPAVGEPDLVTAGLAGQAGDLALVVGPGTLPAPAVLTYTPSGRSTVSARGRDVTLLVPDARLSAALATGLVTVDETVGTDARSAATPATAAQDLLAELAVITRERPNDSRHVLATVSRDWTPDVAVATAQLEALASAPWVRLQPVSALIGLADPEIERGTLPARSSEETEIASGEITALTTAIERRQELAGMLAEPEAEPEPEAATEQATEPDPEADPGTAAEPGADPGAEPDPGQGVVSDDVELELLAALSVAWRDDPAGRAALVARAQQQADALADAVSVTPTTEEGINVLSTSADLPVNVANALAQPITVQVRLRPDNPRLRADDAVPVTIPAQSEVLVRIPVHAVQSADVSVTVEVLTPDGAVVDDDASFLVRVRAEWEGIGTAILGGLLAIGLVVGIVRTIRRGRTARRSAPQVDAGPDALSPEVGGEGARA